VLAEETTSVLFDPGTYPSLEAVALTTNVPGLSEVNEVTNLPLEPVVPDVLLSDPPLQLRVTEVPWTGAPPQLTSTVRVEVWFAVMLPGSGRILMLSCGMLDMSLVYSVARTATDKHDRRQRTRLAIRVARPSIARYVLDALFIGI
jgi:hypothetical protein